MFRTATLEPAPVELFEEPSDDACPLPAIARQAIVDVDRAVFGYELFNRARASDAHTAASDAELLFGALSHTAGDDLFGDRTVFLNCTHETLSLGHLDLIHPDRVVLEVPPIPDAEPRALAAQTAVLADLQRRGFRFAFDHTVLTPAYAAWLPMASFIKLDLQALDADVFERLACAAQTYSTAELIAEKVENAAQFDRVRAYGINLFQGYWLGTPHRVRTRRVAASQGSVQSLAELARAGASPSEFDELLRHDVILGFNLLQSVQASGFGHGCEFESFGQAVHLFGHERLLQWSRLMLSATRARGPHTVAAGSLAAVRGRMMELLAPEALPAEAHAHAFRVGSFSLLADLLEEPQEQLLARLMLPEPVIDALLWRRGPLATLLSLVEACERAEQDTAAHATQSLGLSPRRVQEAHLKALRWASDATV